MDDSASHHTAFQAGAGSTEVRIAVAADVDMVTAAVGNRALEIRRGSRTANAGSWERRGGCWMGSRHNAGRTEVRGRTYLRLGLDGLSVSVGILYWLIASGCCVNLAFQDLEMGVPGFLVLICALVAIESDDGEILDMVLANVRASVFCGSYGDIPPRLQAACLYPAPSEGHV